jgi:hypothetical protein
MGREDKDSDRVDDKGVSLLAGTSGVREVSAAGNGDGIRKADGGLMLPVVLRPATGEGIRTGFVIPQVGKVPLGAQVGKDVEQRRRRNSP